ncbi:M56 family metallopeptidase [Tissierella sp.]|uniref:M56 family metallopeptidase n=1 Tax=Tissierella sp. TaxID=41274 RepID=UPI003F97B17E
MRLIFNFEVPGSIIVRSKTIFPKVYDLLRKPLYLEGFSIKVFQVLVFIWITVGLILAINNIFKYMAFKRSLKRLEEGRNRENEEIFNRILRQKEMNKKIQVIQHDKISSPFILGILKGKIYIPNIELLEEDLEYIILHEINHFLDKDALKKVLIQSIKYIFWWNPFAHLFANNFNHILEIQCDLKTTVNFEKEEKTKYLESITKIISQNVNNRTRNFKLDSVPNFARIKEITSLKQRFLIVLNYKHKRNIFKVFNIGLYALALVLFISSYFIIIQPHYEPTDNGVYIDMDADNSFILEKPIGSYDVYIDNKFKYNIEKLEDLDEKLSDLPIYKEDID